MTTGGVFNEYATTGAADLTVGSDGNLWFTEGAAAKIGAMSTSGALVHEYSIPAHLNNGAGSITADPAGNLWFLEPGANTVGKVTTGGAFTEYFIGSNPNSLLLDITIGPDGNPWFTDLFAKKIGTVTSGGVVNEYSVPDSPFGITTTPLDGNLWFTEGSKIGTMDTAGTVLNQYSIPTGSAANSITADSDGNLWFVESGTNQIGKLTVATLTFSEYPIPTLSSDPFGITAGPDGNLWFTESGTNKIGMIPKNPTPADVHDLANEYAWSATGSTADGAAFQTFIAALNAPACFGSQCDWRLPTIAELQTIVSDPYLGCGSNSCIDRYGLANFYWSATSDVHDPSSGWAVSFGTGDIAPQSKTDQGYVRAVRGGL